ncbi:MAG: phage portal protein, partial [Rhodospirillaceae bacterium]
MTTLPSRIWQAIRSIHVGPITSSSAELAKLWQAAESRSGVAVNEASALSYSAVWAAVALIASDVASLPLVLYRRTGERSRARYVDHPLYELLHDAPNPEMTSLVFRETLQAHVLTWGNGYAEIQRDGAGRPVALWPLSPDRVTVERVGRELVYRYPSATPGRPDVILPASDVLHVPGLGYDGLVGYSVIRQARESIGLGLATER